MASVMFIKTLVFLSVFSVPFLYTGSKALQKGQDRKNTFERTLLALDKILKFYNRDYDLINLDSLLGLRVAQGILKRILTDNMIENSNIEKQYKVIIREMYNAAGEIIDKAMPFVRGTDVPYKTLFKIVDKPWDVFHQFQKLDHEKIKDKKLESIMFAGPVSDHCISLLLADSTRRKNSCNITDDCWKFETQKDLDGYAPPHQVLYFLLGQRHGCENIINEKFKNTAIYDGLDDFFGETCANVLTSVKKIWQDKNVLKAEKDLFIEQTLICSLIGYEDFLSETYLNTVLQWQTDAGCFGKQVSENVKSPSRELLFEKQLNDGCLVHETGVGVALLAQYTRWMLHRQTLHHDKHKSLQHTTELI